MKKGNFPSTNAIALGVDVRVFNARQSGVFMIGTHRSWRTDAGSVSGRKSELPTLMIAGSIHGRRIAVASAEPEDAQITGMTRSLDRRLLALNLKPVASEPASSMPTLRVA
jgi:hypothetical protein